MSLAGLSSDARAVVRAADDLTTQVRRIADALTTPVVQYAVATDDATTTAADDGRRKARPLTLATPCAHCTHPYNWHKAGVCQADDGTTRCDCIAFAIEAPATGEDALRAARRDSLDILLARLERGIARGIAFTPHEASMLREHIGKEIREHDTMRAVAAGNKRHVQAMYADLQQAQAERDGAYRERAQLLALLASLHPSVIAPAPDVDESGWQILYLQIGGKQASWHIAPRDAELFAHVEHVPVDDRRAQWDGHTTEEKYAHIGEHAARLYAEARGRVETTRTPTALDGTEQTSTKEG